MDCPNEKLFSSILSFDFMENKSENTPKSIVPPVETQLLSTYNHSLKADLLI